MQTVHVGVGPVSFDDLVHVAREGAPLVFFRSGYGL